ncbi:MAG TPA: hypothetical protein VD788_08340, partial [Candidatus Polarisedimenticolaceae bacterium]|nr:hypothetical protein [Candidatus Polarisedimenticolaceae bacterium]
MVRSSLGIATAVGALVVLLLLVSCGGGERPATATPAEDAPQRILIIVTSGLAGDDATAIVAGFAADRPETVVF